MWSFWHTVCIMVIGAQKLPFLVCEEAEFGQQTYLGRSTTEVNEEGRNFILFIYLLNKEQPDKTWINMSEKVVEEQCWRKF